MFTGIVETTGTIIASATTPGGRRLRIDAGEVAADCRPGASVCVSGVCLTVAQRRGTALCFDVIAETLAKSTLGSKRAGDRVNLERSLKVGERIDGHFVQGHVDGTAKVSRVERSPREHVVWLRPEESLLAYLPPKGSVAVDGVSLTIAALQGGLFSVALISTTLERTTLGDLSAGDAVNIETDMLARAVVHSLSFDVTAPLPLTSLRDVKGRRSRLGSTGHSLTLDALQTAGFV